MNPLPTLHLEALRGAPDDSRLALVTADAWLAAGDVRGELLRAQLAGEAASVTRWWDQHGEAFVARTRASAWRVCGGLVREVRYESDDFAKVAPDALRDEPVVTLSTPYFGDKEPRVSAARLSAVLEQSRLFGLDLHIASNSPVVAVLPSTLDVVALRTVSDVPGWLASVAAPSLKVLSLGSDEAALLNASFAKTVEWLQVWSLSAERLEQLLAWPKLQVLDVRGVTLEPAQVARLREWASGSRRVVHEAFSLEEAGPFAHVFSAGGVWRCASEPAPCFIAAKRGSGPPTFACAEGRDVRGWNNDNPAWRHRLDADVTGLMADEQGVVVSFADGTTQGFDSGGRRADRAVTWPQRAEATSRDGTLVARLERNAVVVRKGGAEVARWVLPAGVSAVVATSVGFAAASPDEVWGLVPGAAPKRLLHETSGHRVLLAAGGAWVGWSNRDSAVTLVRADGTKTASCTWPGTYSSADGDVLEVGAIDLTDDGLATVALTGGGINLLDGETESSMKADEHPGQPFRRWIFIFGGNILVAG